MSDLNFQLCGKFRLVAVNADTGEERVLADWFDNIITDNGLNLIGTDGFALYSAHVGSGSAAPSISQTQLQTLVASTTSRTSVVKGIAPSAPYYRWTRTVHRFAAGAAAGNLSEVGIGAGATSLFSRALIKDGLGAPTTITVLSNEFLDVSYEVRVYSPTADVTGSITISGTPYNFVMRAARVNFDDNGGVGSWADNVGVSAPQRVSQVKSYIGVLGSVTGEPANETDDGVATNLNYTAGNFYRDANLQFGLDDGNNAAGITAMQIFASLGYFQCSFTPAIPKDSSKQLSITTRISWARRS